jgi:hypothetical protein
MSREVHLRPPPPPRSRGAGPTAQALAGSIWGDRGRDEAAPPPAEPTEPQGSGTSRPPATETIGRRAGSLSDELDFPEFVASLIHGTWDAMVDSSIRQMDSFADLVAAISKPLEQFRDENVTANQARDWLVSQYPGDLSLGQNGTGRTLVPRGGVDEFGSGASPDWLADYGLADQPLTTALLEEQLVPTARDRMARDRMQTLATLVMLGMNRIVVRDGSITARLRFRAAAADRASVDYAVSDDPGNATPSGSWATRGSTAYTAPVTKVSTVGVNAQTDSTLNAELFGEVKINFASETIPLERFVDDARRVLLDRAARPALAAAPAAPQPVLQPVAQPAPAAPVAAPAPASPGTAT